MGLSETAVSLGSNGTAVRALWSCRGAFVAGRLGLNRHAIPYAIAADETGIAARYFVIR